MLRRILFLVVLAVLTGCSDQADVTGVPPQSAVEPEKKKPIEVQPTGGVNKCAIYRTPDFCPLQ